jgi:hypothetical protein
MKKLVYFGLLAALFVFNACSSGADVVCSQGNGNYVEQTRATPIFHAVVNKTNYIVRITQSNTNTRIVKVLADENLQNIITTQVIDGELVIRNSNCLSSSQPVEIHVTLPTIMSVENAASGKVIGENVWFTHALGVINEGSGEIDIEVDATHISAFLKGSGKISLYGVAPSMNLEHTSSGSFKGYELACKTVEAYLKGSGDAWVRVSEDLKVSIESSGDLYYKGYPYLDIANIGTGSVRNDN